MGTNLKKTKFTALITYVIVLVCMIATLFIPTFDNGSMIIKELPDAFKIVTGLDFSTPSFFTTFGLTSYFTVYSAKLNLAALAIVIYAAMIVLGILALIPVCICKKQSKAARVIIYIVEVVTMLALLLFVYDRFTALCEGSMKTLWRNKQTGIELMVMLFIIWLMSVIQSIYYKKSSGVMKAIMFVLSFGGLATLFGRALNFNALSFIGTMADKIGASEAFVADTSGYTLVNNLGTTMNSGIIRIVAVITAFVVIINLVIDALALVTNSGKASKNFNIIRYGIELLLAIAVACGCAIRKTDIGLYLYALIIIAAIELIISVVRRAAHHSTYEYEEDEDEDEDEAEEESDEDEEDEEEVEEEIEDEEYEEAPADSARAHGFYEAPGSTSDQPPVYTRAYTYQDDGFLNSLTPAERAEFFAIFIDKRKGNFYFLPEYEIGGDNKEFFQNMFIYLSRFMGVLSDGLMNKIYRRLNIIS